VWLGWKHLHGNWAAPRYRERGFFFAKATEPLAGHQRLCMHHPEEYPVEFLPLALPCRWPLGGPGPSAQGALNQQHFYLGAASGQYFLAILPPFTK
jgi:hypothetical protein